jgi:hypothetical protein
MLFLFVLKGHLIEKITDMKSVVFTCLPSKLLSKLVTHLSGNAVHAFTQQTGSMHKLNIPFNLFCSDEFEFSCYITTG